MGGKAFDGHGLKTDISAQTAKKIHEIVAGTITTTYIATAKIGTDLESAKWSVTRVVEDTSTGITRITWAEKNGTATAKFVHPADDLPALTYS